MNRKQKKVLSSIFSVPTSGSIKFSDIEKLFISLGAIVIEGRGSRVAFVFPSGIQWEEHRPHPQKEAKKYQVESARRVLQRLGYANE
ncbi:MAG: type II toxin-antitoxin system HicA family toxin [Pyrinomonadaceae bacterium]